MTVSAHPKDVEGANLQTKITNLTNAQSAIKTQSTKDHIAAKIDQAQKEAVLHFIEHCRLPSASMMSTMMGGTTTPPAGLDNVGIGLFKDISNLVTRINAMKAGPVQEAANQKLDKLQREMMVHCFSTGFVTAAQILSNMA